MTVPEVLLSGNHLEISNWRRQASLQKTAEKRSDLLETSPGKEQLIEQKRRNRKQQPKKLPPVTQTDTDEGKQIDN